jgi:hypothetical protein
MTRLEDDLLELAGAPLRGGADAVARTLAPRLESVVPYRAAEIALLADVGWRRWPLSGGGEVAGEGLLEWLRGIDRPRRIDELDELPGALRDALAGQGLLSLLACPLGPEAPGALVLYHESRWGFAGASLRRVQALASMAGLALSGALRLAAARAECRELRARLGEGRPEESRSKRRRRGRERANPGAGVPSESA